MLRRTLLPLFALPGVVVHELAHALFCLIFGVKVRKICLFRFGDPAGYVAHDVPENRLVHILIAVCPFLVNTLVGAAIAAPAVAVRLHASLSLPLRVLLVWLAVSIATHAFPSRGDAKSVWNAVRGREAGILWKLFAAPIVAVIYLGSAGSLIGLDLLYGVVVAIVAPNCIANRVLR